MQWVFIVFFIVFAGLLEVSKKADKDDYKSGKQEKIRGSSGPHRWTENGDHTKAILLLFSIIFVIIVLLLI
jgi:hypothetical protein